jgi:hypothetical protein
MAGTTVKNTGGEGETDMRARRRKEVARSARCVGLLAVLAAAPLSPVLVGGRVLLPADFLMVMQPFKEHAREMGFRRVSNPMLDAVQQFWPWRAYAGGQLRRGVVPLWNPHMLSGTPFAGNNQSAVFYPETWLFAMMAPEKAFGWAAALYLWASGCFMFFFLRTVGLRRRAAMVGSVAWMYNGFVVGWMCLPSFRSVPGWLPLILGAFERAVRGEDARGRAPWVALAGLGVGMQFLAGNLHISFYVLMVCGLYAAGVAVREGRRGRSWAWPIGAAAVAGLMGGALAAIQLAPTLEFAFRSARQGISYADVLTYRMVWAQLLTGLMPDLYGNPVDYNHWGAMIGPQYRAYTETAWYTGAFALVLAAAAVAGARRRQVYFWAGIVALGFLLALGTPLDYVLYRLVPGFRQLPGINRAIVMACFAVPVLAAYGMEMVIREGRTRVLGWAAGLTLVGGLAAACWAWIHSAAAESGGVVLGPYTWMQFLRFAAIVLAGCALVTLAVRRGRAVYWALAIAVMAIDGAYFGYHFMPRVAEKYAHPPSEIVSRLQEETRKAEAAGKPFRVLSVGANFLDRMPPNVPMLFGLRDVQGSDSITYGRYARMLDALSDERYGFRQPALEKMGLLGVRYIVSPLDLVSYRNPSLEIVRRGPCNLYEVARPAPMASARTGALAVEEASVNHLRITAAAGELAAGEPVLVRQTCYPGWRAYADGREAPIIPANYCQQLVPPLSSATRAVDLVYEPTSFKLGSFASLGAIVVMVALGVMRRRRR